jgi:hypothetical protein
VFVVFFTELSDQPGVEDLTGIDLIRRHGIGKAQVSAQVQSDIRFAVTGFFNPPDVQFMSIAVGRSRCPSRPGTRQSPNDFPTIGQSVSGSPEKQAYDKPSGFRYSMKQKPVHNNNPKKIGPITQRKEPLTILDFFGCSVKLFEMISDR